MWTNKSYVLFDTQQIMKKLSPDEVRLSALEAPVALDFRDWRPLDLLQYIMGALRLYLDAINVGLSLCSFVLTADVPLADAGLLPLCANSVWQLFLQASTTRSWCVRPRCTNLTDAAAASLTPPQILRVLGNSNRD
jgi:hypothetical protein